MFIFFFTVSKNTASTKYVLNCQCNVRPLRPLNARTKRGLNIGSVLLSTCLNSETLSQFSKKMTILGLLAKWSL